MLNRLAGQPESYDRKSRYKFGKTLGAGTYGIVREAECAEGNVAIKIILKKNVKGNEQMVYDELMMLRKMKHPHIVRLYDWFESRDKYYIVTQLATGGELFDRICEWGRFTERDASQTIRQVLEAVDYLHENDVVHRDLKPENLLYLTREVDSTLVLADFGIAKMLGSKDQVLLTMAGSFGYAAPEVMLKQGHGKPVDLWSLGVITYTLLCGYSPFRSESLPELIEESNSGKITFHERFWKDVSKDAKDFIVQLLQPRPEARATSKEALRHVWLSGETATEHNLLPEIKAYMARARFRRGVEIVKLKNRLEALKMQEDEDMGLAGAGDADVPANANAAAAQAIGSKPAGTSLSGPPSADNSAGAAGAGLKPEEDIRARPRRTPSRSTSGDLFREVVMVKLREDKELKERAKLEREATEKVAAAAAKQRSST
ncbi:MAG: hypothetical protein M1826_000667 [Phylliscum demangeonii]|nr:MAG: hypothetical protein M1826_000667 [Phylliscum demangeonii]